MLIRSIRARLVARLAAPTVVGMAAILGGSGCGKTNLVMAPANPVAVVDQPQTPLTRNVILVSIDGLRPDALATFNAPTLQRLVAEGSYTLSARTILPSLTLPSHTSMLTGETPDRHGVLWNNVVNDAPGTIEIPTIFSQARERGYLTAAFFSKAKFSHLQRAGTLDYSQAPGGWFGRWSSAETLDDVERYLETAKPNLLFVHLTDPDAAGHSSGWMSASYGRGVARADSAIARLIKVSNATHGPGNYTLIVTADHGGHGNGHGSDDPRDVTIPWVAWGQGVLPGELAAGTVNTTDTAATVLFLLGLDAPTGWAGVPVRSAFSHAADN